MFIFNSKLLLKLQFQLMVLFPPQRRLRKTEADRTSVLRSCGPHKEIILLNVIVSRLTEKCGLILKWNHLFALNHVYDAIKKTVLKF